MTSTILVLWDLDLTLLDPAGFGHRMIAPELAAIVGGEPVMDVSFAGRTDHAILTDLLAANRVRDPDGAVLAELMDAVADRCETNTADFLAAGGRPLPGAHAAVSALACVPHLHQGIVTGNMRRTALLKLRVCGFTDHPDPRLGGFGDRHENRARLVLDAVDAARGRGLDIDPSRTVVVGDTVHDVRAALDVGARAVGVATGRVGASVLRDAGADLVLLDLTDPDPDVVVSSITRAVTTGNRPVPRDPSWPPAPVD